MTVATRRTAVWVRLLDGKWHTTMEINAVDVGGSEGCRRLRELRRDVRAGKFTDFRDIVKRRRGGNSSQYEYKLVRVGEQLDGQLGLFDGNTQ